MFLLYCVVIAIGFGIMLAVASTPRSVTTTTSHDV